jgi:hypothetical protein
MKHLYNITAVIFTVILLYVSIHTADYGLYVASQMQDNVTHNSGTIYSSEKPDLVFINRQDGRFVTAVRNFPVSGFKIFLINIYSNKLSLDFRTLRINPEYLSYQEVVERSLKVSDIVFPFHYFW